MLDGRLSVLCVSAHINIRIFKDHFYILLFTFVCLIKVNISFLFSFNSGGFGRVEVTMFGNDENLNGFPLTKNLPSSVLIAIFRAITCSSFAISLDLFTGPHGIFKLRHFSNHSSHVYNSIPGANASLNSA